MPVSAEDFIHSATLLHSKGSQEMDWRNAASRAFYGTLHCAEVFLKTQGLKDLSSHLRMGTHERIIEQLSASELTSGKALAYILQDMKRRRVIADYRIEEPFQEADASLQLKTALRFNETLKKSAE